MTRKVYADLTVKVIVEFDDDYEDAAIMSTEFISDYSFEASEGASIVSTEITDIEITDAK